MFKILVLVALFALVYSIPTPNQILAAGIRKPHVNPASELLEGAENRYGGYYGGYYPYNNYGGFGYGHNYDRGSYERDDFYGGYGSDGYDD